MSLIGGSLDIDPQFFADHLNNTSWYRIADVENRLTALPSVQKLHDFLQLRFIEIRTVLPSLDSSTSTRQVVSVWLQERKLGDGWIGVVLLDPPFKMPRGGSVLKLSEYRSFWGRLSLRKPATKAAPTKESHHKTLIEHIREKFEGSQNLLEEASAEPFLILGDLYRLVASNWIVVNEYINRELSTIEYIIVKDEPIFRDLEIYLKEVYVYRRRCTKYQTHHPGKTPV